MCVWVSVSGLCVCVCVCVWVCRVWVCVRGGGGGCVRVGAICCCVACNEDGSFPLVPVRGTLPTPPSALVYPARELCCLQPREHSDGVGIV